MRRNDHDDFHKILSYKRRSREVWKIPSKSSDKVNIISNGPNRNYVPSDKIQEHSIASVIFLPKIHNLKSNHKETADKLKLRIFYKISGLKVSTVSRS